MATIARILGAETRSKPMRRSVAVLIALCPAVAVAAEEPPPRISVAGTATVETPPDLATIETRVVGEGVTSDEAVAAMVAARARIAGGLASLDRGIVPRGGDVAVAEVRGPDCRQQYGQPQLSTGACAVVGYVASLQLTLRTASPRQAGTIVGLIGRLGGRDPRLAGFQLADPAAARRRAVAAALLDAHARAEAVARGTGVTLGRLLSASDSGYGGDRFVVPAIGNVGPAAPPAPPPPPPPIPVDLIPRPIETQAQVSVTYAIMP